MTLNSKVKACMIVTAALTLPAVAHGQTCTYNFQVDYEQLTRLTDEFDTTRGDGDSKTELISEGFSDPTDQRKETYYVLHTQSCPGAGYNGLCCPSGTDNFFRAYNPTYLDYRDSPLQNDLAGYATNALLGCPFTSLVHPTLSPMSRYYDSSLHDYKTWLSGAAPAGYTLDASWPVTSATPRLAYQRFGNLLDKISVENDGFDAAHTIDNTFLKLQFNKIWGDMVGMITYDPTGAQIEYANPGEIGSVAGDGVQTVVRWSNGSSCRGGNPTQAGGTNGTDYSDTTQWAGSPIVSESTTGSSPNPITFTSVVRPFDFEFSGVGGAGTTPWPGAEGTSPLAWRGWIQRSDTLGCVLVSTMRKDVIFTSSELQYAEGYMGPTPRLLDHANTYWLAETPIGDYTKVPLVFEWVDLTTTPVTITPFTMDPTSSVPTTLPCAPSGFCGGQAYTPTPATGKSYALVITNSGHTFAYALVMKNIQNVSDYLTIAFHCSFAACSSTSSPGTVSVVMRATRGSNSSVTTGSWSLPVQSYLVVNDYTDVMSRLSAISRDDGNCLE